MSLHHYIPQTQQFVRSKLQGEGSGHDWWHVDRVRNTALNLCEKEGGDKTLVELGALLHDIADWKFHDGDEEAGPRVAEEWLSSLNVEQGLIEKVKTIIREVSFKGAGVETPMSSLEGAIVQDADRLDALGAIGIARTFAYGGSKGRPIHIPGSQPDHHGSFEDYKKNAGPTIDHFYEKLLLLKDRMNTPTGKQMAAERHAFMERFLEQFYQEWGGG